MISAKLAAFYLAVLDSQLHLLIRLCHEGLHLLVCLGDVGLHVLVWLFNVAMQFLIRLGHESLHLLVGLFNKGGLWFTRSLQVALPGGKKTSKKNSLLIWMQQCLDTSEQTHSSRHPLTWCRWMYFPICSCTCLKTVLVVAKHHGKLSEIIQSMTPLTVKK